MYLADFHIHSTFSDGRLTVPELIDFYGTRGFGAIAVTDHLCERDTWLGRAARYIGNTLTPATFPLYLEILKSEGARAWDQYRMVVLPGYELTKNSISNHRSAHILGLGIQGWIDADLDATELIHRLHDQGALAVAAHPVSTGKIEKQTLHLWNRRRELEPLFDAWEVTSGPRLLNEVLHSRLPMLANSDLHHPRQIRSWKNVLECEKKPEAILEAIRKQEIHFHFYDEEVVNGFVLKNSRESLRSPLVSGLRLDPLGNVACITTAD